MCAKLHSIVDLSDVIAYDEGTADIERENQKSFRSSFPDGFKRARKESGLTQEQFAEVFDVNLSSVRGWEQGRHTPEIDTIEKICNFFGCSMDYLFMRTDFRNPDDNAISDLVGLDDTALLTLQWAKKDPQIIKVLNHVLSNRILVEKIVTLFASKFFSENCVDIDAEGRAIPHCYIRNENNNEMKYCLVDTISELESWIDRFYKEYEDDQLFSRQMAYRLLKCRTKPDLIERLYKTLKADGGVDYTPEQVKTAVEFLLYCGYRKRMEQDNFEYQPFLEEA